MDNRQENSVLSSEGQKWFFEAYGMTLKIFMFFLKSVLAIGV